MAPTAKIPMTAIFCLFGSCSWERTGIGRINMVRSVTMFTLALKNQRASKFRQ